jgi:hypothetical protein
MHTIPRDHTLIFGQDFILIRDIIPDTITDLVTTTGVPMERDTSQTGITDRSTAHMVEGMEIREVMVTIGTSDKE